MKITEKINDIKVFFKLNKSNHTSRKREGITQQIMPEVSCLEKKKKGN